MSEILPLKAELRNELGKGAARALRKSGMTPATIYGKNKQPLSIAIEEKEITKCYRKPQYMSQVIEFEVGKDKHKVLPKSINLHPITEAVSHADFVFLADKMQKMQVPVVYKNKENCIGVKRGGYFNIVRRMLTILCPVEKLPRKIEIDIKASDAILPEGAKLLEKPEFVIASIIGKKGKSSDLEEEAENAGEGETEKTATAEEKKDK